MAKATRSAFLASILTNPLTTFPAFPCCRSLSLHPAGATHIQASRAAGVDWVRSQHSERLAALGPPTHAETDSNNHFFNLRSCLACWSSISPVLCYHMYASVAVYYAQIKKIESYVIRNHEEYSMIAFHLNAEGKALHCKPPEDLLLLGSYMP